MTHLEPRGFQKQEMAPKREVLSEPVYVGAEQLYGMWLDSRGHTVIVYFADAYLTELTATLTKNGKRETHLPLRSTGHGCGWQCGRAFLVAASEEQLWWEFPNGNVSIWERSQQAAAEEEATPPMLEGVMQQEDGFRWAPLGLCAQQSIAAFEGSVPDAHGEVPDLVHEGLCPQEASTMSLSLLQHPEAGEDFFEGTTLSGCQSPQEAFFNPKLAAEVPNCFSAAWFSAATATPSPSQFCGEHSTPGSSRTDGEIVPSVPDDHVTAACTIPDACGPWVSFGHSGAQRSLPSATISLEAALELSDDHPVRAVEHPMPQECEPALVAASD